MTEILTEKTQLELAREVGNIWTFEGREMEMYVARGEAQIGVNVLNLATREPNGNVLIHNLKWDRNAPFLIRQAAFKTVLKQVGRQESQEIESANLVTINGAFYRELISGGVMIVPVGNGESDEKQISREQMLEFVRLYPESASEVIESWLDATKAELIDEESGSFEWMFTERSVVKVLWRLGNADKSAAAVFTFKAPTSEKRATFDNERQKIKSRRQGELKISEVSESFLKKLNYGAEHLQSVEGIAVGSEGAAYTAKMKDEFITLFNPIWFAEIVDVMHESFDFTKGKAAKS